MTIDIRKRAIVPMRSKTTGEIEFELVVYGVTAKELMTAPSDVISSLAARYPDHHSTIWDVRNPEPFMQGKRDGCQRRRNEGW